VFKEQQKLLDDILNEAVAVLGDSIYSEVSDKQGGVQVDRISDSAIQIKGFF